MALANNMDGNAAQLPNAPSGFSDNRPKSTFDQRDVLLALKDALEFMTRNSTTDLDSARSTSESSQSSTVEYNADEAENGAPAGFNTFWEFQRKMRSLDEELTEFRNTAGQLSGIARITMSTSRVQMALNRLVDELKQNSFYLFSQLDQRFRTQGWGDMRSPLPCNIEAIPSTMRTLAAELGILLTCLADINELSDDTIATPIQVFQRDLEYWASSLGAYQDSFMQLAVQQYLQNLTLDIGNRAERITGTFSHVTSVVIPRIRVLEDNQLRNPQVMLAVATFFSGVTATTLQTTSGLDSDRPLWVVVTSFFLSSLVFSVSSVVNTLLVMLWQTSIYRSPERRIPTWFRVWLRQSANFFLLISVLCFSIGLAALPYLLKPNRVTGALTLAFTSLQGFGMLTIFLWIGLEQSIVVQTRGRYWPQDVGTKHWNAFRSWLNLRRDFNAGKRGLVGANRGSTSFSHLKYVLSWLGIGSSRESTLPVLPIASEEHELKAEPGVAPPPVEPSEHNPVESPLPPLVEKRHLSDIATSVIETMHPRYHFFNRRRAGPTPGIAKLAGRVRLEALRQQLEAVGVVTSLAVHAAPILDVQFAAIGGDFATASEDSTVAIFHSSSKKMVTASNVSHHIQDDIKGFNWSPVIGGGYLVRLATVIEQWTSDGVFAGTFHRRCRTCAVVWFPDGQSFLSAEIENGSSQLVRMDVRTARVLGTWDVGQLMVRDIALCPTGARVVIVAKALASANGLRPSRSRMERRIFVYNLTQSKVESQAPVFNDVHRVVLARNGNSVLTTFDDKAQPQLWDLGLADKDRECARLTLMRCYGLPSNRFLGTARFGGSGEQCVMCPTEDGGVTVWDRETGTLLRRFRTDIRITSAAADPASRGLRIVGGSREGAIRIWDAK